MRSTHAKRARPPYALALVRTPAGTFTALFLRERRGVWVAEGDHREGLRALVEGLLGEELQLREEVELKTSPEELARKRGWRTVWLTAPPSPQGKGRGRGIIPSRRRG